MKTGLSLQNMAAEIERQANAKKDYVAKTTLIRMTDSANLTLSLPDADLTFGVNDLAHGQIAEHVKIPKAYYDRMRADEPALLATNVETWFKKFPAPRMVRTLDGNARAFLSDKFRPLDNYDLAEAVMPTLLEMKLDVMSCQVTERRMYIKAVDERLKRDVPTGRKMGDGSHCFFDTCSPAIIISNSEVGYGRLSIEAGVYTKVCTNMAMIAGGGMKRHHVGAKLDLTDAATNIDHLLSTEARKATDRAIWLSVRDVVKGAFNEAVFAERCKTLGEMSEDKIEGDVVKVVELSAKKFGLTDLVAKQVQRHLIEGGDLTRYGLFNAVTRTAQDIESYDEATEMERLGGRIIELPRQDWRELAMAA